MLFGTLTFVTELKKVTLNMDDSVMLEIMKLYKVKNKNK